jgi:hypothetical protein
MSDNEYNLFDEDDNSSDLPKKLRAKIKELQAKVDEQNEFITTVNRERRQSTIAQSLEQRGLNPKIAGLVPADIEGDALDEWIGNYADVFGVGQPAQQATPAYAGDQNRMAALEQGAMQSVNGDVLARIDAAQDMDELMAVLKGA